MNGYEHAGKDAAIEADGDVNRGHKKREAGGLLKGGGDDEDVVRPIAKISPVRIMVKLTQSRIQNAPETA